MVDSQPYDEVSRLISGPGDNEDGARGGRRLSQRRWRLSMGAHAMLVLVLVLVLGYGLAEELRVGVLNLFAQRTQEPQNAAEYGSWTTAPNAANAVGSSIGDITSPGKAVDVHMPAELVSTKPSTARPVLTPDPRPEPTSAPTSLPALAGFIDYSPMVAQLEADAAKHFTTHDSECNRFILYGYRHCAGFGSQYNNMLFTQAVALWENRTLVMMPDWLRDYRCALYDESNPISDYDSCFKTRYVGPPTCAAKSDVIDTHMASFANLPTWSCEQTASVVKAGTISDTRGYIGAVRDKGEMPKPLGDHMYDLFDFKVLGIRKLWVLQDAMLERIDGWKAQLKLSSPSNGPVCGFHVRRGDKGVEAPLLEVKLYFEKAQQAPYGCKTCFVASDDIVNTLTEVRQTIGSYFPDCEIKHLPNPALTSSGYDFYTAIKSTQEETVEQTQYLLGTLEMLSETDIFVGSYRSSNIGRLVALLRAAKGKAPNSTFSVDSQNWDPFRRMMQGPGEGGDRWKDV